ncbi:MAG: hypothetical protein JJE55_08320 [Flavobacteriaceae bacterium]|nr:hypothetical protein [Flavobacteriaceae bacterium]
MRELKDIKNAMTATFVGSETVQLLYGLNPANTFEQEFSIYSIENIFFDIFAFAIWTLESLFYILKNQIDALIVANKHGKLEWYINTALNYQHGFELDDFGDYINGDATPEEIAASKIIANVAFEKSVIRGHGVIRAKVVRLVADEYVQLLPEQLAGFHAYINRKTLFGLAVLSMSRPHDTLTVNMKIWYDPLVLDSNGSRLDGTDDAPAITAIKAYLKSVKFNGEFVGTKLVDEVQKVQGVAIPKLIGAAGKSSFLSPGTIATPIEEVYATFAGYMRLDVDNSIFEYIART